MQKAAKSLVLVHDLDKHEPKGDASQQYDCFHLTFSTSSTLFALFWWINLSHTEYIILVQKCAIQENLERMCTVAKGAGAFELATVMFEV